MRLHKFIGDFDLLGQSLLKIEDKDFLEQARHVLRFKVGDKIILADGKLNEAICRIEKYGKDFIELLIEKVYKNENEPKNKVVLYCAVLKKENFEWVAQKATEVGISEIQPIITERTVKQKLNLDRLRKIIREAAEQSGRGLVPVLYSPVTLAEVVEKAKGDCKLFFDSSGNKFSHVTCRLSHIAIFIGPEGGWTEKELEIARTKKFKIVSLGKLTLRAETSAVIVSYLATSY